MIHILPGCRSAHDIIHLLHLTVSPIIILLVDDEFIGTGATNETVSPFVVFGVTVACELVALDGEVVSTTRLV